MNGVLHTDIVVHLMIVPYTPQIHLPAWGRTENSDVFRRKDRIFWNEDTKLRV